MAFQYQYHQTDFLISLFYESLGKRFFLKVTITILDENDLAPKFHFTSYRGEIKENVPIGSSVLTVSAFDSDLSNTTKVNYDRLQHTASIYIS